MNFLKMFTRALGLLGPEARLGWLLAIANVALAGALLADPVLLGRIVDALVVGKTRGTPPTWEELAPLVGLWLAFALFIVVGGTFVALGADRLAHRRRQTVLTGFFEHVLQLPLSTHDRTRAGHLLNVMITGTDALWGLWLAFLREHFAAFVLVLVGLPLSLLVNWRLAVVLIGLALLFALFTALSLRKAQRRQASAEPYYADVGASAADTLTNVAVVQSFARVEAEVTKLKDAVGRVLSAQMPVLSWWAVLFLLTRTSTVITLVAILLTGIFFHLQGLATIGEIVAFMTFSALLIGRLEHAVGFIANVGQQRQRLREFFDILDTVPLRDRPDAHDPGRVRGLVEFKGVSFSFDGKRAAVADVSFTALPGETIAIVGNAGSGKSTTLALLHRAFDPQSGVIMVDGMDVRGLSLAGLRRNIGVVPQEPLMFNRSIAENLRVGKPDATDDELRAASERVQALNVVERHLDGFAASAGPGGNWLVEGERQRLSIARALLKDPPILILDEATSALDAATEAKVQAALDEVMKGRTTFVIARRLATLRNATRILVFEGGRIIETGTFEELVKRGGHFSELARSQFVGT